MRRLISIIILLAASITTGMANDAATTAGRDRSEAFLRGDLGPIWDSMTPEMREALGTEGALAKFRDDLERDFGSESELLKEETQSQDGQSVYLRTARWTKADAPVLMHWAFDGNNKIAGFFVRLAPVAAQSQFLDYQTKAALRLPFEDEWFVFWGGRTLEANYHAADKGQRFATDFVVRKDGATHSGDAADLSSYFCWDRAILAPAAGAVIAVVDGQPDQPIGQSDPANPAGNHVVLDLGNGEFAFLAHMRQGSIAVQPGTRVASGQEIGRCGNSGNTSEPHLHFHLQTTPELGAGEGLPAFFVDYFADGEPVSRGEPVQGQKVSPDR